MDLWQMDVVSVPLSDGRRVSVLTGVDDHSRFCVVAKAIEGATARPVCEALAEALGTYGVPEQILTHNGRVFTARLGPHHGETLFDRICRQNGIEHLLTRPYSPTTTGKIERFHGTLRTECFAKADLASIEQAQAALDDYVVRYNTERPHQALDMATPAERFQATSPAARRDEETPGGSLIPATEAALPDPDRAGEVIRRADSAGNFGLARARYSAGRWLAGQLVVVRCTGDVVEIYHRGELVKAHPRKHAKEKEETMSRTKRTPQASRRNVG